MLTLKRRVHEQVVISHNRVRAARLTLTVQTMVSRSVSLLLELPTGMQDFAVLEQGSAPFTLKFMGHPVEIHLRSVVRGEVRLGFIAPYEIKIERAERLQQKGTTQ